MAKKRPRVFQLKRSKIKVICEKYGFKDCVMLTEDGKVVSTSYSNHKVNDEKQTLVKRIDLDYNSKLAQHILTLSEKPKLVKLIKENPEVREDFAKNGYEYDDNDKLIITDFVKKDVTDWCLCVDAEDMYLYLYKEGLPAGYYNTEIIREHCTGLINDMLEDKIFKTVIIPDE